MNLRRRAIGLAGAALLLAWLAAAFTGGRTGSTEEQPSVAPVRPDSSVDNLLTHTARLHDRLAPDHAPRHLSRNLFRFVSPAPIPVPAAAAQAVPLLPAPPPTPSLKLVGIAEDTTAQGPVRTAVISGLGQVFLVKEGDEIVSRYRVVRISVEAAELTDLTDGTPLRLALK